MRNKNLSVVTRTSALVVALTFSSMGMALDAHSDDQRMQTVRSVDFSGSPPFKRTVEQVPVQSVDTTDLARFEEVAVRTETRRVVDYRGRPPFKRRLVTVPVVEETDFARFEEVEDKGKRRRSGPPGKNLFHN